MSATQQQIKLVAGLKLKKHRAESGLILVEGRHPIEEALRAGLRMVHYFTLQDASAASLPTLSGGVQATFSSNSRENQNPSALNSLPEANPLQLSVSQKPILSELPSPIPIKEDAMARMASTDSPPPCLAVFEKPAIRKQLQGTFALVLDTVQDPGNLGTLIRSAIAFGVDSVVLAGDCVEPYSPKVIRASAGLIFALPVLECRPDKLNTLFSPDWTIYGTTGQPGAQSYREADYSGACAVVLGNEGRGVSADLFTGRPVTPLTIPMDARVESLNVGVSGSIILAEAAAKRRRAEHA